MAEETTMRARDRNNSPHFVAVAKSLPTQCVNWVTTATTLSGVKMMRRTARLLAVVSGVLIVVGVSIAAGSPLVQQISRQLGEPVETAAGETATHRDLRSPSDNFDFASLDRARPAISTARPAIREVQGKIDAQDAAGAAEAQDTAGSTASTATDTRRTELAAPTPPATADVPDTTRAPAPTTTAAPARATTSTAAATAAPKASQPKAKPTPTTSKAPATTAAPATAAPPPVPVGNAGHGGSVGCQGACNNIGFQNLDNSNGVTLENVVISNPGGRCISARNAKNLTLRNVTVQNCGTTDAVWDGYDTGMIDIDNSNTITIENSIIRNISAGQFGGARNNAIQIINSPNITIKNNLIQDIHSNISDKGGDNGNRAISVQGNNSHKIRIERNTFRNAGRNALQIKQARNLSGISFSNNIVEGRGAWNSDYEDMVNMYSSSGRSGDPIVIRGNYMRNGGPSNSGTAIIVGDGNTGAGPSQFILVERNVMVNPGHVGINLAGGDNIVVKDNVIYGNVNVPHDTTVGLIINHFGYSSECRDHVVTGNRVYMQNQHKNGNVNHVWIPGSCTQNVRVEGNNFGDQSLTGGVWNP